MTPKSSLTDDDNEEIQRHDRSSPVEHDAEAVLEFIEATDVVGGTVEWIYGRDHEGREAESKSAADLEKNQFCKLGLCNFNTFPPLSS